jgi:hypothetical protein
MSVNKYTTQGGLQTLANGSRCWIGTKAAYEAAVQAGTMENDILVAITDDDDEYKTSTIAQNDNRVITSGGVYDALTISSLLYTNVKWVYMGSNTNIELPSGTYLILAVKPQWKKQAIFSVDKVNGIAEIINVNNLSITKTDTTSGFKITFGDTYMQPIIMCRNNFTYTLS